VQEIVQEMGRGNPAFSVSEGGAGWLRSAIFLLGFPRRRAKETMHEGRRTAEKPRESLRFGDRLPPEQRCLGLAPHLNECVLRQHRIQGV
jgi:hypothetical protein